MAGGGWQSPFPHPRNGPATLVAPGCLASAVGVHLTARNFYEQSGNSGRLSALILSATATASLKDSQVVVRAGLGLAQAVLGPLAWSPLVKLTTG